MKISYKERPFILTSVEQSTVFHHKEMFLICIAMQNLSALQHMGGKTVSLQFHYIICPFQLFEKSVSISCYQKAWIAKKYRFKNN